MYIPRAKRGTLLQGGAKYQDAFYIFEEFVQSNTAATVKLLNNLAVSNLALGRYPEAESQLLEALNKVQYREAPSYKYDFFH